MPATATEAFVPVENLSKVVPQVVASGPELVMVNGDAARLKGMREDYVALKELLAPVAKSAPVCIGLGNHDDRRNFLGVFEDAATKSVGGKHVTVIDRGPVRFLVLDSLLYVDKVAGLLGKAQRNWLASFLESSDDRPHIFAGAPHAWRTATVTYSTRTECSTSLASIAK